MSIVVGLKTSSILAKICMLLIFVSTVANWISFTTTSWGINNSNTWYTGIWRKCTADRCAMLDGVTVVWFGVFQAFAVLGFMGINVAFVVIALYIFGGDLRGNREAGTVAAVICIFTSMFWLVAVSAFGAEVDLEIGLVKDLDKLGFSYGLAVAALGIELITGLLMVVEVITSA
ncbi:uncharacterized protein LOC131941464 [Physella acuta]|uniref:uncharacterized protein LOC131941464 n=1 Tax=Physella acuta TaxID=109671 RepID=UPI0027DB16E0|nr:uncharacterized protein LOC131941464 [Physella acuta]XP_059156724.1 uncharacterized protein LOC131941464 [Physella acuta]